MKRETLWTNTWFRIAKTLTMRCCKCKARHVFKFRVRKNGVIEMMGVL